MTSEHQPDDAQRLDAIDRAIRENERLERAKEHGLDPLEFHEDCPPSVADEFVHNVLAFESAPIGTDLARLESIGLVMPDPDLLDDHALHTTLWHVIRALADFSSFLDHTDHLSDRELYRALWSDVLREEKPMFPPGSGWQNHIDMIGSGSELDIEIGLRFYDSGGARADWARDFPNMHIPPREPRPYDRDRSLPKAPEPSPPTADDELGDALDHDDDQA